MKNNKMTVTELVRFFVAVNVIASVLGHGMMFDPASRNSAWRFFPNRPAQYTDNQLNCGGFSAQWDKHNGKCGVCGDEYNITDPKYVYPGLYAQDGFITKTYKEGQIIQVTIKITSNHQGFFRFSVGKLVNRPITQEQLKFVLFQPDGSNTWQLHSSENGEYHINLVLPNRLTCDHCVLQWWWTVGNNWGCDENGNCGIGLGKKQETFVNCADIKIIPKGDPVPTAEAPSTDTSTRSTTGTPSTEGPPTQEPSTQSPSTQKPSTQSLSTQRPPSEAPATSPARGTPTGGCKSAGAYAGQAGMDEWCVTNCAAGYCPTSHCVCN